MKPFAKRLFGPGLLGLGANWRRRIVIGLAGGFLMSRLLAGVISLLLHRYYTHQAFKADRRLTLPLRFVLWISTGLKPREWAAVHRKHHLTSDTAEDPHSPQIENLGYPVVQLNMLGVYKTELNGHPDLVAVYASDVAEATQDWPIFDQARVGLGVGITLACVLFGPVGGAVFAGTHLVGIQFDAGAINGICHRQRLWITRLLRGRQNYDNLAVNVPVLGWLIAGEGLHNNHHAKKGSARFAHRPGEVDPLWPVIVWLERRGLVWGVKRPENLPLDAPVAA